MPKKESKPKEPDYSMQIHELNMRLENLEDKINKISSQIGNIYSYDYNSLEKKLDKEIERTDDMEYKLDKALHRLGLPVS